MLKDGYWLCGVGPGDTAFNAVYPAYFVPEMVKADVVFRNMKKTRNSFAVIIDEYGGIEGIVTFNDLVEELVGEMNDEHDESTVDEPIIEKIGDCKWQITGNALLRDIEEALDIELDYEDYDTLSGLAFDALGRIPEDDEQDVEVSVDGMSIHIDRVVSHQIELATIELPTKETAGEQ